MATSGWMQDKLLAHEQALIQLAGRVNKVEEARVPLATQLALLGQPAPARVVEGQMNWVCPKCGARDRIASDDIADALRAARAAPTPPALDVEAGREDDWDATREDQNSGQAPQGEKR